MRPSSKEIGNYSTIQQGNDGISHCPHHRLESAEWTQGFDHHPRRGSTGGRDHYDGYQMRMRDHSDIYSQSSYDDHERFTRRGSLHRDYERIYPNLDWRRSYHPSITHYRSQELSQIFVHPPFRRDSETLSCHNPPTIHHLVLAFHASGNSNVKVLFLLYHTCVLFNP